MGLQSDGVICADAVPGLKTIHRKVELLICDAA